MWTKASRGRMVELEKRPKRYPTDLTDEGWEIIAFLPPPPQRGRRPPTDLREALNAPRYLARSGGGCCRRTFRPGRQSIGGSGVCLPVAVAPYRLTGSAKGVSRV